MIIKVANEEGANLMDMTYSYSDINYININVILSYQNSSYTDTSTFRDNEVNTITV